MFKVDYLSSHQLFGKNIHEKTSIRCFQTKNDEHLLPKTALESKKKKHISVLCFHITSLPKVKSP